MIKKHLYNPGDLVAQHWNVNGEEILTALYLIYDKVDTKHSIEDVGYTSYRGYVVFTHCPYGREDRSGLNSVGETYEITHWNDWEIVNTEYPSEWTVVGESGLSWEDAD